jgi:hypothetical protein
MTLTASNIIHFDFTAPAPTHTVEAITWHWNEGIQYFDHEDNRLSLDEADRYLRKVACDHSPGGGYSKVKFTAHFADGKTYGGRFDVHHIAEEQETYTGRLSFLDHMRGYLLFMFGERKPSHMTDEEYRNCLKAYGADFSEADKTEWRARLGLA